jgi:hypothetical protein
LVFGLTAALGALPEDLDSRGFRARFFTRFSAFFFAAVFVLLLEADLVEPPLAPLRFRSGASVPAVLATLFVLEPPFAFVATRFRRTELVPGCFRAVLARDVDLDLVPPGLAFFLVDFLRAAIGNSPRTTGSWRYCPGRANPI